MVAAALSVSHSFATLAAAAETTGATDLQGGVSMVYLQYSAKLRAGRLQDFVSLLNSLTPVVAKHGWQLLGSYASVLGRLNTVVDLWELPNEIAIQAALSDPEVAKYASRFGEITEDQTLNLLNKLPISGPEK
jgi:catabolite regulation protein CreA